MSRPPPGPQSSEIVGADALRDAVSGRSATVADLVGQLDSWGFTLNDTRFSVWSLLVTVAVVVGLFLVARLGSRMARRGFARLTRLDPTQQLLGEKIVSIIVWTIAGLVGIDLLGIDLTALTVFSGAFGLAIGFGLQKTFGNFIAGIILLMDKSIKPGDVIAVADMNGKESFGQIRKIGIRAISIITRDRKEYLIPNENLMINQVENWSYSSRDVRVKAPVNVAYGSDIELVEKLLLQATEEVTRVLASPEPKVLLMGFGESALQFELRFWISDPEEGMSNIRSDVLKRVWHLFQQNGIRVPFPQRDLALKDSAALDRLTRALEAGTGGS